MRVAALVLDAATVLLLSSQAPYISRSRSRLVL